MKKLIKFIYRINKHPKTSGVSNILMTTLDLIITLLIIFIISR